MNIPDGVQSVEAEGRDLKKAIAGAAKELGIDASQIDYKVDLTHFRSGTGVSVARNTVKIVAWPSDRASTTTDEDEAPARPKRKRAAAVADEDEEAPARPKRKRRTASADEDEDEAPARPKRKRRTASADEDEDKAPARPKRKRAAAAADEDEEAPARPKRKRRTASADEDEDEAPARPKRKRAAAAADEDEEAPARPKRKRRTASADEDEDEAPARPKRKRAAAAADEDEAPARPKRKRRSDDDEARPRRARADSDEEEDVPRRKRRSRDDTSNGVEEGTKPEQLRGAEDSQTKASRFAQKWFENLLSLMDVEGKVVGSGNDERVHLAIDAERAGRIVGKRGATLGAIRHLLGLALERRFGELTVDVDVGDDRREERAARPQRERSRGRDRGRNGGRERGGERRERRDRGDRGDRPRGRYPEEKLQALARRGAEKALDTGRTYTINLELNAYDRRVIHVEISEIDGVDSQSEEREEGGRIKKYVQIIPGD